MSAQIGDRVGALLSMSETEVRLLGYGVYQGPQPCDAIHGILNPQIKLDDGTIVWGYQCWWGVEEKVRANIGTRTIKMVSVNG